MHDTEALKRVFHPTKQGAAERPTALPKGRSMHEIHSKRGSYRFGGFHTIASRTLRSKRMTPLSSPMRRQSNVGSGSTVTANALNLRSVQY